MKNLFATLKSKEIFDETYEWQKQGLQNVESLNQASIDFFKDNDECTTKKREICSKLMIKTPERRHWVALVSLFLTLNRFHTLS